MVRCFVSDLHLGRQWPGLTERFTDFCATTAAEADELWILGDLFDAYLGDDDDDPTLEAVVAALAPLRARGAALHFVAGNRDFALGAAYAERAGLTLVAPFTTLAQGRAAVCHGDELVTDDLAYQALRRRLRDPQVLAGLLAMPLAERRRLAEQARAQSREYTRQAPMAIMDANHAACEAALDGHGVALLIHGHTHRPAIHEHASGVRVVLGDWSERAASWLRLDDAGLCLHTGRGDVLARAFP